MRKVLVVSLVAGALGLGLLVPRGTTAPALADKPPRYEYAELQVARTWTTPPPVAAGQPKQPDVARMTVRWATAEEQAEVGDWEELAAKLKAPPPKRESPATVHKLRVLNRLSELGWEAMDRPLIDTSAAGTVTLRRKLP